MPATGGTDGTETQIYDVMASYEQKLGGTNIEADIGHVERARNRR